MEPNYGYRHTRGFIVFLIIIFCGWVIVAHSQTSYTGNLVDTNWSNGYQVPTLTCWQAGDPNCSPGGRPYVRPDGNINFSYVFTELYQARAIADVLPNSGTGLMATGFQFNWTSKNGNGWDDGRLDQLSAYVQMYSKGGQWIEAQSYNLNFKHDWTDFSWSGNFTKERRGSDLGTILYGFAGKDNNYWLGPYGPEIMNVSFSLRYQPDPCVVNPLHSTECPGFLAAINKPIPGVAEASASYSLNTTQPGPNISAPTINNATSVIKLNAQREQAFIDSAIELATSSNVSERGQFVTTSASTTIINQSQNRTVTAIIDSSSAVQEQDSSTSNSLNTSTTTLSQFQPVTVQRPPSAVAESSQTNSESDTILTPITISVTQSLTTGQMSQQTQKISAKTNDLSVQQDQEQFLSLPNQTMMSSNPPAAPIAVIRTNTRNQDVQNSTTEQEQPITVSLSTSTTIVADKLPTVQKINQRTESQTKVDTAIDNVNVLDQFVQQNTSSGQAVAAPTPILQPSQARTTSSGLSQDIETTSQVTFAMIKIPEISLVIQSEQLSTGLSEKPVTEPQLPSLGTITTTISSPTVIETLPISELFRPPQMETANTDAPTNTIATALMDRTNPLNETLNGQQVTQSNIASSGRAVKSNTTDNDLAGGVSISQIARVPVGFDVYTNLAIREIAFYQSKEIYRGQRTVDNVRALRSLGQDARHQQMVNQQYLPR